jgi:MerR family redox-sensitive transcriptional activator SoxR
LRSRAISESTEQLQIGQVAERAGIRKSAIRYYEEIGLLEPAERVAGRRIYEPSVLRRLSVINVSQRAGLSLDEIRELIEAGESPTSERLQSIAAAKLPEVEALIARAEAMRDWLKTAEGCGCQTIDECGLFDEDIAGESARLPQVHQVRG